LNSLNWRARLLLFAVMLWPVEDGLFGKGLEGFRVGLSMNRLQIWLFGPYFSFFALELPL